MISRRDVLRGIGGWSAVNAARIISPSLFAATMAGGRGKDTKKLNVMLHGLFLLNIVDNHIQLLTPDVCEHIYKAGDWDQSHIADLKDPKGKIYKLKGVRCARTVPKVGTENIVLSRKNLKFEIDPSPRRFEIELPFPEQITFLRSFKGTNLYRGLGIHATGMALCTMLTYSRCGKLELADSGWEPRAENESTPVLSNVRTLHIWAEPATRVSPLHTGRAYAQLMCFFRRQPTNYGMNFTVSTDDSPPLDHAEAIHPLGLLPEEEMGWSEWENNGEGSRPTNCNTVIVTP
jgi:hypothetical protein